MIEMLLHVCGKNGAYLTPAYKSLSAVFDKVVVKQEPQGAIGNALKAATVNIHFTIYIPHSTHRTSWLWRGGHFPLI